MSSQHQMYADKLPILGNYSSKYYVYLPVAEAAQACYEYLANKGYSCIIANTKGTENNNYFLLANSVYSIIITSSHRMAKLLYYEGRNELLPVNGSYIDGMGVSDMRDESFIGKNPYPKQFGNVLRDTTIIYLLKNDRKITMGGSELESLKYAGHPDIDVTTGYCDRFIDNPDYTHIDLKDFIKHINLLYDSVVLEVTTTGNDIKFSHRGESICCLKEHFESFLAGYAQQKLYVVILQKSVVGMYTSPSANAWHINFNDSSEPGSRMKHLTLIDNRDHYLPINYVYGVITHTSVMKTLFIRLNYISLAGYNTHNRTLVAYFSPSNVVNRIDSDRDGITGLCHRISSVWDSFYINCPSMTSFLYPGISFVDKDARFELQNLSTEWFKDMRRMPSTVMPFQTIMVESIKFLRLLESMLPMTIQRLDNPYHKVWDIIVKDQKFYGMSQLQTVSMSQTGYVRYVGVKLREVNSYRYICSTDLYDIRGKVVSNLGGLSKYNSGDINGYITYWPEELDLTAPAGKLVRCPIPVFVAGHHMYLLIGSVLGTPVCITSLYNQISYHFSLMRNGARTRLSKRMLLVKDYLMEYDDEEVTLFHSPLEMYLGLLAGVEIIRKFWPQHTQEANAVLHQHVLQLIILLKCYPWSVRVSDSVKDVDLK